MLAPVSGRLLPLSAVPDNVFAGQLLGSGVAIDPVLPPAVSPVVSPTVPPVELQVLAPVTGTVVTVHPHAAVLRTDDGAAVLVHVGVETVTLRGAGLRPLVGVNTRVSAGEPLIAFSPEVIRGSGRSLICPVVVVDSASGSVADPVQREVTAGEQVFTIS
ncbi:PTS glucose transporter subunit IIA [Tsukamurella serpentis]